MRSLLDVVKLSEGRGILVEVGKVPATEFDCAFLDNRYELIERDAFSIKARRVNRDPPVRS
ncbi:MAG: hypothetical protein AB7I50_11030 [Vicinamibacterales bacterium]